MGRSVICFILVAFIAVSYCSKPRRFVLTKDQKKRIAENILTERPNPEFSLNANLEDTIKLIGVDISPKEVKAGEKVKMTYYWESLKEAPGAWKIFVHLELPGRRMENLDHHPVQSLYPIKQWKKGEIIRDIQEFRIGEEIEQGTATLWVGVFNEDILREHGTGERMKLLNSAEVPNDGNNRVRAAVFTIAGKTESKMEELPKLRVVKVSGKINLDGKLDEPVWGEAERSKPFRSVSGTEAPADIETTLMLLYDEENLYFGFKVKDKNIFNNKQKRDDMLWEQDVVEIYIDHDGDGKEYVEIQIAPNNLVFDALFSSYRTPQWQESSKKYNSTIKTAVFVRGTLNNQNDTDEFYTIEAALPFKDIPGLAEFPPKPGTFWKMNFFRIDELGTGKAAMMSAFSPVSDFHDLKKAGHAVFIGSTADMLRAGGSKGQ